MVCPNLRSSHEGDTLVFAVEQKTLWFQLPRRRQTDLYRSVDNAVRNTMDQHIPSIQSRLRSSNGPVEQARGRRGLLQTSWEAQLPVDHADPTDRTIIVRKESKIQPNLCARIRKGNDSDIENERTNEGNDENVNPKGEYPLRKSSKTAKEDDETTDGKTAPRNYRKIKPPPIHASGITLGDLIKEAMKVNINQNNHFLVQVTNNSSMKDLITIKYVAYQKARWERPRKKIVLQCKKCQRLGHDSRIQKSKKGSKDRKKDPRMQGSPLISADLRRSLRSFLDPPDPSDQGDRGDRFRWNK
ncbi:hypothetical protein PV325_004646 [Microctonus aethiopoides]|nr:hypothetical protein PV325_004646 [Microctonus aethiopoides]